MAESAEVIGIEEVRAVAAMSFDVELSTDNVVNVGRDSAAATDDAKCAQHITRQNEWNGALAPGCRIVESLKSGVAACNIPLPLFSECAIVVLVCRTVGSSTERCSIAVTADAKWSVRHTRIYNGAMNSGDEFILGFVDRLRDEIMQDRVVDLALEKLAEAQSPDGLDSYVLRVRIPKAR